MKPWNATFRPLTHYRTRPPTDLDDVMDFARALEDTAHAVTQPWALMPLENETRPPTERETRGAKTVRIGENGPWMRAWCCARLRVPPIAALVDPARWGRWQVQIDTDGLGDIYADGALAHPRLFLHGTALLTPARGPKSAPWVCYSMDTTIQTVKFEMARSSLSGLAEINDLVRDVARSLRTAANLLLTRNPRVNRFLKGEVSLNRSPLTAEERARLTAQLVAAARAVDAAAFLRGDLRAFLDSLRRCREALQPLAEFAKGFHLFLLGVSHMDLAWKWRWGESIEVMRGTLANQFRFMAEHPDFHFLESSPPVWRAMKQRDPKLYRDLLKFARRGQLEPAGGMWCEPDGQMLGAESWVRQTIFGQRAAREICGQQSRAGHNTDAFGFSWALPKIYAGAEMEAFLTQKLRYNEFTLFEEVLFWWEADDGTRILGVHTYPDHYQEIDPDEMAEAVRIFHLTSGVRSAALLFGIGNHGGGPLPDMFDRVRECQKLTVYPTTRMAGMHEYLDHVKRHEPEALARLPVIRDELFLECHHKTYTVQARTKADDRRTERELCHTEALGVMAGLNLNDDLRPAWEIELFNQFHDILPGTSFPMVYQDVNDDYARAYWTIQSARGQALRRLVAPGNALYVANTLPWRRKAAVTLHDAGAPKSGLARDDAGNAFPFQRTGDGDQIVAVLPETPAFGLRRIALGRTSVRKPADFAFGPAWARNRFFRVEFDPKKGYAVSLKLPDGFELAGEGIGRLDLLEDDPEGFYQTWNMNLTGREDIARCESFALVESGPVRARFRARLSYVRWEKKKDFMVPIMWNTPGVDYPTSFFTVDYIIYRDLPWIECVMEADWWEDDTDLKVAAWTSLRNTRAFYSIPFGQIERPTRRETPREKGMYEVPALNWADLTDGRRGVALFNTGRHGHDALAGRLRLTLLTSPYGGEKVHVPDPLADRGRHTIQYAFYPHAGGPEEGNVARMATEYEYAALTVSGGKTRVPIGKDLLSVDPDRLLVTAVKAAEDGRGIIVRAYEPKGVEVPLEIEGSLARGRRTSVNLLERDLGPVPERVKPHQVVSVRVEHGKDDGGAAAKPRRK